MQHSSSWDFEKKYEYGRYEIDASLMQFASTKF